MLYCVYIILNAATPILPYLPPDFYSVNFFISFDESGKHLTAIIEVIIPKTIPPITAPG